jgi:hypothetical protein
MELFIELISHDTSLDVETGSTADESGFDSR